jgi:hypothetical protein
MNHDDECIHALTPGTCSYCKPQPEVEAEPVRIFPAKYEGHCRECNLPIRPGDMIAWIPDRAPIHEACA